jgi:hypothetical protein
MNRMVKIAGVAAFVALAACGGKGDDSLGSNVEQAYDNQADALDAMADNTANEAAADALENQADTLRKEGDNASDAIDAADVDTRNMNMGGNTTH